MLLLIVFFCSSVFYSAVMSWYMLIIGALSALVIGILTAGVVILVGILSGNDVQTGLKAGAFQLIFKSTKKDQKPDVYLSLR